MCLSIAMKRPDAVLARGEHAGHEWMVIHNGRGYRCGYVKVEPGHLWHGRDESDIDARAHGGVNFSEADVDCGKGGADNGWWFGFDTNHAFDARDPDLPCPAILRAVDARFPIADDVVRTQEYVEAECRSLCEQAARAKEA